MRILTILILPFLIMFSNAKSHADSLSTLNEHIFQLLEDAGENVEDAVYFDRLESLIFDPLNLNSADMDELLSIPFLNPGTAANIIRSRKINGPFQSVDDLYYNNIIDKNLLLLLRPLTYVDNKTRKRERVSPFKDFINFRSRGIFGLRQKKGYSEKKFAGNNLKSYSRLKFNSGNFKGGLLIEKDPGEISFSDHFAGFLQYTSFDRSKKIIIGDFNAEFGQGLVLWRPYSFSKGSQAVISPLKKEKSISPFLSTEENLFFRGMSANLLIEKINLSLFYSNKKVDGLIEDNKIVTFGSSGYHRTKSEISKTNRIENLIAGATVFYSIHKNVKLGFLFLSNKFSKSFTPNNKYGFSGKSEQHFSFSLNYKNDRNMIDGEFSIDEASSSILINYYFSLSEKVDILLSYRDYAPSYHSFFSNGIAEFGNTQNEYGLYFGTKIKTVYGNLNFYYDQFRTKKESYYSIFPIDGYDLLFYYDYNILRNTKLKLKIKYENKEIEREIFNFQKIVNSSKMNCRLQLDYRILKTLYFRTRIEYVHTAVKKSKEQGLLTYQDVKCKIGKYVSFALRAIVFETDSYNSRLYEFENDMIGVMTNVPLYGSGVRWYVLCKIEPYKNIDISFKYSESYFPLLRSIGSGDSEIKGKLNNVFGIQADLKF